MHHAFPCGAMAEYKNEFPDAPPTVAIVTDFAVHGFWIHPNIDRYIVATETMGSALMARGVAHDAIYVSGIPVRREFAPSLEARAQLRERLDLPRDRYIVLLMVAVLEFPRRAYARCFKIGARTRLVAVVVAGRNARIERRLARHRGETRFSRADGTLCRQR